MAYQFEKVQRRGRGQELENLQNRKVLLHGVRSVDSPRRILLVLACLLGCNHLVDLLHPFHSRMFFQLFGPRRASPTGATGIRHEGQGRGRNEAGAVWDGHYDGTNSIVVSHDRDLALTELAQNSSTTEIEYEVPDNRTSSPSGCPGAGQYTTARRHPASSVSSSKSASAWPLRAPGQDQGEQDQSQKCGQRRRRAE